MDAQQLINYLRQITKPEKILTDSEDRYIYSFEKIFEEQNTMPDVVVKTFSSRETQIILELAEKEGFTALKRGQITDSRKIIRPLVLLDDSFAPELKMAPEQKRELAATLRKIHERGHGTARNLGLALKSLFSEKNLAKCHECETCSGYCTVASFFEGVETWSSKGRILTMRGLQNRELAISEKVIDILYACTECGLCFAQCFQDLEVNEAVLATRREIAKKGLAPQIFHETTNNIIETGDPGAVAAEQRLLWMKDFPDDRLSRKPGVLYWVGCMVANRTPKTARAFFRILSHANINFTMLKENEGCCGYIPLSTGLWNEAKKIAEKVLSNIEKIQIETLVTPCAGCYYTFSKLYPEILGVYLPCEIFHASQFIEDLIKKERIELKNLRFSTSYHDPCSLGRHSGVFDPPRSVLKKIPGLTLAEMPLSRTLSRCCGGGGGLWSFNHKISMNAAYLRLKDLKPLNVDVLTTACPLCQINFRYTSVRESIPVKVCDITEVVETALR